MSAAPRDPWYVASLLAIVAVIVLAISFSRGGDDAAADEPQAAVATATPTARAAATPTAVKTPGYDMVLLDAKRAGDLDAIADAVELFRQRTGRYPTTTGGAYEHVCTPASDVGCGLASYGVTAFDDGELPYWYSSDGSTYFNLVATSAFTHDVSACGTLPGELSGKPAICIASKGGVR